MSNSRRQFLATSAPRWWAHLPWPGHKPLRQRLRPRHCTNTVMP